MLIQPIMPLPPSRVEQYPASYPANTQDPVRNKDATADRL
jgi:hypothetical protein